MTHLGLCRPHRAILLGALAACALALLLHPHGALAYLPWTLSNFQNEYVCDTSVRLVRPVTLDDVQAAVRLHTRVKAVGGGWSWNMALCTAPLNVSVEVPRSNATAVMPVTSSTTLTNGNSTAASGTSLQLLSASQGLRRLLQQEAAGANATAPSTTPSANTTNATNTTGSPTAANLVMTTLRPLIIDVDEADETVLVDAGVRTYDLLQYLGAYVTRGAPAGWTLPAFPWFVYQTIGGAVSTGTHGSSLKWGSLSSQVVALHTVLANGTVRVFDDESDPFLMKALRVSQGQLAVITHVRLRIVREVPVARTLTTLSSSQFVGLLQGAQAQFNANKTLPAWINETEWFWIAQRHQFMMVQYTRADSNTTAARTLPLAAYIPQNTTIYNTSLELLKDMKLSDYKNLQTQKDAEFDPDLGLALPALEFVRNLNNTIINAPWNATANATIPAVAVQAPATDSPSNTTSTTVASRTTPTTPEPPAATAVAPAMGASAPVTPAASAATAPVAPTADSASPATATAADSTVATATDPATATDGTAAAAAVAPSVQRQDGPAPGAAQALAMVPASATTTAEAPAAEAAAPAGPTIDPAVLNSGALNATQSPAERVEGVRWTPAPTLEKNFLYALPNMAGVYLDISRTGVFTIAGNKTLESSQSYLYQPTAMMDNIRTVLYDQYEVAFPVSSMADCWEGLLQLLHGDEIDGPANGTTMDYGFRTAPLVRVTGAERRALLSVSNDAPHMWLNIEDYLYYNGATRKSSPVFKSVMGYLRSDPRCGSAGLTGAGGRLHWGKAGWPDAGCWHGDKEFGNNWCSFGCATRALDPENKFVDAGHDRWTWRGVDLERCCGASGFNATLPGCGPCKVTHARNAEQCPPAPYYTWR